MRVSLLPVLACLFSLVGAAAGTGKTPDDYARMRLVAEQLVRTQVPSGLFPYEYDLVTGAASDPSRLDGVVLVRQCFAAFVLARYGARFDSREALDAVRRFLGNAANRSLPIGKGAYQERLEAAGLYSQPFAWLFLQTSLDLFGLLYSPDGAGQLVSADGSYQQAYPGATALALAAGLKYQAATGDREFAGQLGRWARGLLAVQVPGRGFREAPHHLAESDYLNGEAWLALALYAGSHPRDLEIPRVLEALDAYLLVRYAESPSRRFYHWGSMAAAARAVMTGDQRFDDFLAGLTRRHLADNAAVPEANANSCHVVEGLASFVARAQANADLEPLVTGARERIAQLMAYNRRLQILPDTGFQGQKGTQGAGDFAGSFLGSVEPPRTRLDYTGHCLNALLIMERAGLLGESGQPGSLAGR